MLIVAKHAEIMLYLQFGKHTSISMKKKTSKWKTHLPYLHVETLKSE